MDDVRAILQQILGVLEAQDAKIKALEAQLEASGVDIGDIVDVLHSKVDGERFEAFSGRHRGKFEPYLDLMDKLEGGDSFRAIYDKSNEFSSEDGYEEDAYIDGVLASVIETIEGLKAVAPPEVQSALEEAEEAVKEAAVANDVAEDLPAEEAIQFTHKKSP